MSSNSVNIQALIQLLEDETIWQVDSLELTLKFPIVKMF